MELTWNRNREVSCWSPGLKLQVKEVTVAVLALSQLSWTPEMRPVDHRPQLGGLRESGSLLSRVPTRWSSVPEGMHKPQMKACPVEPK